jgi:hypothetical protein
MTNELSNEQFQNAEFPINDSFDFAPNSTVANNSQPPQQRSQRRSTDDGIKIDRSDEHNQNAE